MGTATKLTPITRDSFGKDGTHVLHGVVEAYARPGKDDLEGVCLCSYTRDGFYTHPTLFADLGKYANLCYPFQVTLDGNELCRQAREPWDDEPRGQILRVRLENTKE